MEAWRQRLTRRRKKPVQQKPRRIHLTPTGLLMEGDYTQDLGATDLSEVTGAFSGSLQCRHLRTMVLNPHNFESAKNGFPHRGHLKRINQFPAITAKIIHPKPTINPGVATLKSQMLTCASRNTNGTNPRKASRLRFLRLRYSRHGSASIIVQCSDSIRVVNCC